MCPRQPHPYRAPGVAGWRDKASPSLRVGGGDRLREWFNPFCTNGGINGGRNSSSRFRRGVAGSTSEKWRHEFCLGDLALNFARLKQVRLIWPPSK